MLTRAIYLDFMATTPIDPRVIEHMLEYMGPDAHFGNPSSPHRGGEIARHAVENARQQIADTLHTTPQSILFTSGATESNNIALLGAARFYQRKGRHIITMQTEHQSVLDVCQQLTREGFEMTYLPCDQQGILSNETLAAAIRPDTILVSIMHVNNETGVIQDLESLGRILRNKGIIFHVDAAQSAGKLPLHVDNYSIDLMSLSAHKNYGPKGIGALYIRQKPRIRLQALMFGGGQEQGLRPGTLATHQIVGMGAAFALSESLRVEEQARLLTLRMRLWAGIQHLPGIQLNGHPVLRIAGNLHFSLPCADHTDRIQALYPLIVSNMSACRASKNQTSYVLRALGLSNTQALHAVRLALGRTTSEHDIDEAIRIICQEHAYTLNS